MFWVKGAYAQITSSALGIPTAVGNVSTFGQAFIFIYNFFIYFGGAGVVLGICYSIFLAIYKNFTLDSEEALEHFTGSITKAVLITLMGILMLSAGFIVNVVARLLGTNVQLQIPSIF